MERVTFLVEESNERLSCMLNPESVQMRRATGVRPRESLSGPINSDWRGDNPLLFTGSGVTTLELDLVFDVSIPGSSITTQDVRELTKPIWDLSENYRRNDRSFRPAICRFIWGKYWNIPGVISAIAEKLESFSPQGIPGRSWLRLRLLRMQEQIDSQFGENNWALPEQNQESINLFDDSNSAETGVQTSSFPSELINSGFDIFGSASGRIDRLAYNMTGDSSNWREIVAKLNLVAVFDASYIASIQANTLPDAEASQE